MRADKYKRQIDKGRQTENQKGRHRGRQTEAGREADNCSVAVRLVFRRLVEP